MKNKMLSFVRLDYITIKPYITWKNLLLFLVVFVFIGSGTGDVSAIIGMSMMYSVIFACYPFSVGEKNGIDALYATLPITKKTVVIGRYIFTVLLNLTMFAASLILSIVLMTVAGKGVQLLEIVLIAVVCFALFTLVEAIQLPLYFKLGYNKAKYLTYFPLLCFPAMVVLGSFLLGRERVIPFVEHMFLWIQQNGALTAAIAVILWVCILMGSAKLSLRFYGKREF